MQLYNVILLALVAASTSAASTKSSKRSLKWSSCPQYTVTPGGYSGSSSGEDAECAVYDAPLCHPGICETPEGVDPTIDVFVKRMPATTSPETARNVWLLQGGSGISSVLLEPVMVRLYTQMKGKVNVYLMDHRGTGRSTRLDCSATEATNTTQWSTKLDSSAVGACAKDLNSKYGDMASFSMTSAATDVAYFIGKHTNGEDTTVFGWSYGTALAERLMHLNPPSVTGYVLDSIATSSGASPDKFQYTSKLDADFGEVADRFLALCEEDEEISSRFKKRGLSGTIEHLIAKFDKDPKSMCGVLINGVQDGEGTTDVEPASFALRRALGTLVSDPDMRKLIPPVVYRLNRCAENDIKVLFRVVDVLNDYLNTKVDPDDFQSPVLNNIITLSEMWEVPTPSVSQMKKRFTDVLMSDTGVYKTTELYCAFSKDKSKACNKFNVGNYKADPITYERDEYWNKRAVIPKQASVLLLSSKLDVRSPHKYAEYLLHSLKGSNKELISFDFATNGIFGSTLLVDGDYNVGSPICGMMLLDSFVKNGGDLKILDKSCVDKMPGFNMTISTEYLHNYLLTADAYDGKYDESLYTYSSSSSDEQ